MRIFETFQLQSYLDTLVSYGAALVLGAIIGAERQYRQRNAGLRTNALVALGAAAFVDLAQRLSGSAEATRVIAYVVSGVGFLGAGVIMKEGMNVRGLNTAATLWCSAAVGACAGTDMLAESLTLTVFVVAGNTLLRFAVDAINRLPFAGHGIEATYVVTLTTDSLNAARLRELLVDHLELMRYPVADTDLVERADDRVDIEATLVSTSVVDADLDRVVAYLGERHAVSHARWEVQTQE
ncbi:MgtC/SapB family protein [Chitinasiproducens palmae]|uniref:Protein MgtC n=1 Tax=Chitinasiproducens palmae TaxID=1770053 RepID=A0A1H2PKP9_9BURK|nr:MgtC/SapB family protein [Chitinasiproducens palmae]SDV46965.1 putative Mg2+ transporter-C (MgtC) family protein [Chitinasiproducens palmae]